MTWNRSSDPDVDCPHCNQTFAYRDGFDIGEGCEIECPHCGATLKCDEIDYVRWWSWSVAKPPEQAEGEGGQG